MSWKWIFAAALLVGATGCQQGNLIGLGYQYGPQTVTAPSAPADLQGTLSQLSSGNAGGTMQITSASGTTAIVSLGESTVMMDKSGNRLQFNNFQTGEPVKVWYTGTVAQGNPVQAQAGTIMLLK